MSWIVAGITAGVGVIGGIGRGIFAMGNEADVEAGRIAAGEIKQDTMDLLTDQRSLMGQTIQSQFTSGQRNIGMGTNMALRRSQAFGEQAYSKSNLATSGTIESKVQTETKDLLGKYKSDMTKLFETRDLSKTEADLSFRKGEMSAEEAYQNTLTGLEGTPTGFWEGVFS